MTTGEEAGGRTGASEGGGHGGRETDPRFLALVGPTAVGKTRLSLEVARKLDGEIICMDSRQVYRGMDVGTAKATLPERASVAHHGLDLLDPDETHSAGEFARDARRWIREIRGRGRVPVLVGGTGFYLKALTDPLFREPPVDKDRRERLREYLSGLERERLESWVERLDPARAGVAAEGGRQRLTRTLEVALQTGRPLSDWHDEDDSGDDARVGEGVASPAGESNAGPPDAGSEQGSRADGVPGVVLVLKRERDDLDRRIRERAERMVAEGLAEEVERLLRAGCSPEDPGLTGAGYGEMVEYLEGSLELDEAVDRMEIRTRQYSRRQLTWFRNQLPDDAVEVDAGAPVEKQVERVVRVWSDAARASGRAWTSREVLGGTE